jgi:coenzyme PQQ precursor peptide PqqA
MGLLQNRQAQDSGLPPELYSKVKGARVGGTARKETDMTWSTPTLVEICIGLEINGYLPAEF